VGGGTISLLLVFLGCIFCVVFVLFGYIFSSFHIFCCYMDVLGFIFTVRFLSSCFSSWVSFHVLFCFFVSVIFFVCILCCLGICKDA